MVPNDANRTRLARSATLVPVTVDWKKFKIYEVSLECQV